MAEKRVIELELKNNINESANSVKSLKAQLREAQADVAALSDKFGATSKEATNAAKKAGELADKIGDAKALTEAFNPDAKFKALSSSLGGVAGGFAAVQGGMALFGEQSEDVEKTLLKVQSAMALSEGLQSVGESVDSFKQLGAVIKNTSIAQKAYAAATATASFVTTAATTGLKLFRIALIGTGIGAIVVALGLLIANFDDIKKAVLNLVPGLAVVGKLFDKVKNAVTDFVGATSDASRALDKLKKDADATLSVNKKFLQEHGDQIDKYTKQKIDAKNAYATALKEDGANQVELSKRLNRELAAIDKERNAERAKINQDAIDKENEKRQKAAEKAAENEKAAKEKALADKKKADEDKKKEDEDYIKSIQDRLQKEKDEIDGFNANIAELDALSKEEQDAADKAENERKANNAILEQKVFDDKKLRTEQEIQLEKDKVAAKQQALSDITSIFGAESAIGKAALVAKQVLNAKELLMDAGKTLGFINLKAAESAVAITGGAAKTASVGFPQNIPLLIGYAAQAAGIFSAIKSAVKAAKGSVSTPNIATSGGAATAVSQAVQAAPQFNVVGTSGANQIAQTLGNQAPIKAFVVANDVTTQASLDRNIVKTATLGG